MSLKTERDEHKKELEEIQRDNVERRLAYAPAEVHQDLFVSVTDPKTQEVESEKVGEVHAFGGRVYVDVTGEFGRDDMLTLVQALQAAHQAVS